MTLSGSTPNGIPYPIAGLDSYDPAGALQAIADAIEAMIGGTVLLDRFYPVGTVYESTTLATPGEVAAALGGGTWVATQQGRVSVGRAATGTFATVGATGGTETVTLTAAQSGLRAHTHLQDAHNHFGETSAGGEHNHGGYTMQAGSHRHEGLTEYAGEHTHRGVTFEAGEHAHTASTGSAGGHTHPLNRANHGDFLSTSSNVVTGHGQHGTLNTGSSGAHTHTVTVNESGRHQHHFETEPTERHRHQLGTFYAGEHQHAIGDSGTHTHEIAWSTPTILSVPASNATAAHNNLQPYVVTFKWLRTA